MTNVIDNLQQVVSMRGTKANIAALAASLEEIVVAYATDTGEFGIYTNSGWVWIGVGSSPLTVKDEGSALATAASSLDFVGAGVVASRRGQDDHDRRRFANGPGGRLAPRDRSRHPELRRRGRDGHGFGNDEDRHIPPR